MRTLLSLLAAVAAIALLAGCGGKSIVGKWDVAMSSTNPEAAAAMAQMGAMKEAMEFKSDGKYTMTIMTNTMEGEYEVKDNTVTMKPSGANAVGSPGTLTISEDGDTMTGSEGQFTITLTRSTGAEG